MAKVKLRRTRKSKTQKKRRSNKRNWNLSKRALNAKYRKQCGGSIYSISYIDKDGERRKIKRDFNDSINDTKDTKVTKVTKGTKVTKVTKGTTVTNGTKGTTVTNGTKGTNYITADDIKNFFTTFEEGKQLKDFVQKQNDKYTVDVYKHAIKYNDNDKIKEDEVVKTFTFKDEDFPVVQESPKETWAEFYSLRHQ